MTDALIVVRQFLPTLEDSTVVLWFISCGQRSNQVYNKRFESEASIIYRLSLKLYQLLLTLFKDSLRMAGRLIQLDIYFATKSLDNGWKNFLSAIDKTKLQ